MAAGGGCTHPLVVLLLLDLLHLVQELSSSQLQLREFVLCCDLRVVVGMFPDLNVQMNSLQSSKATGLFDDDVLIVNHSNLFSETICSKDSNRSLTTHRAVETTKNWSCQSHCE